MVEMELLGVRLEVPANVPLVLLRERSERNRLLPILIGMVEADAIQKALEGIVPPRPLTHDLAVDVLRALSARLDKVVITALVDHTFYAELHLVTPAGNVVVSSRPSDAIALAVRTSTPIFASEAVLTEAGQEPATADEPEEDEGHDAEEILEEFRDFIDSVNPEDFEKG